MSAVIRNFTIIAAVAIFCLVLLNSSSCNNETAHESSAAKTAMLLSSHVILDESSNELAGTEGISELAEKSWDELTASAPLSLTIPELPETPAAEHRSESTRPEKNAEKEKYKMVWAVVTAYCPCYRCCGRGSPGRTSQGKSAWTPGIAADPKAIPYGTKIHVDGYGTFIVDDTGGAMRRSWRSNGMLHIDLRMTYHWQARQWGRKMMKIKVYR